MSPLVIIGDKFLHRMGCELLVRISGVRKAGLKQGMMMLMLCLVAACSSSDKLALPADTPRTFGLESESARDHSRLVSAFGGEYQHARAVRMLEDIVARLVRASTQPDRSFQITLLNSPIPNAFALPSNRLYVTRGLLSIANDSSEIAAVLSHEMAHVTLNHAEARSELQARSSLVNRINAEVLHDPVAGRMVRQRSKVTFASFSRAQEIEADEVGIQTLAAAGFDPYGAARFLTNLSRAASSGGKSKSSPTMMATHPSTADRIRRALDVAQKLGVAEASHEADRNTYLSTINGIAFGDDPTDGVVRGRRFIHVRFGVAFEAPEGFALENTSRAVLGTPNTGSYKLLFDAVESREGQSLEDVLRNTWNEAIETESVTSITVNDLPAAMASSRSAEWNFRLAAVQIGPTVFRLIMAAPSNSADLDRLFRQTLNTVRRVDAEEARSTMPLHISVVTASSGETADTLAARMVVPDRPVERFIALNGLGNANALRPGEKYKLISE